MTKKIVSIYLMLLMMLPLAKLEEISSKPTTCVAIRSKYRITENGYFTLYDSTNKPYIAFCDFQSDPGFAWTLIESLSTTSARSSKFRKSFSFNVPSNECTPNWTGYRLSKSKMTAIKSSASSTHFRATCNFNGQSQKGLQNRDDYLRVSLCAYNYLLSTRNVWTCAIVDYINVRGHSCTKCSIPFYSSNAYHLFIHLPTSKSSCARFTVPEMITNEDAFGFYHNVNIKFSCTANSTSTTNWWIGGGYFD
ncbi:uncharacterized protein TRIADDRAFT_55268 [Trichoplax adhaerens]|uniref:Fibrinogen C-terminal domain-containing protein n=1 Tax=Trichoplax adhaerens TaxID=10228 RepID=B3RUF4_TRIAD|nr:predicted protein [Trichoplax adhaerens]EDV25805.1 predicted protein [Trichoplax adhaerens]|eukprot:XP_002111838.1 predicted protein [Trichoplax adhaerens]